MPELSSLDFHGIDPDSNRTVRTAYRHENRFVEGIVTVHPVRHLRLGGNGGGLWASAGTTNRKDMAGRESVLDDSGAPGLAYPRSSLFGVAAAGRIAMEHRKRTV
jgi:hypothetical protein